MRWQIAHFIFCDQQQTLTSPTGTQQLEPMVVELLRYFCRQPNMIISKDELIEEVWLGRVVSDNAVSKLITKLRKAFSDDAKKPQFIATFPKKGYKFIAAVSQLDTAKITDSQVSNQKIDAPDKAAHEDAADENATHEKTITEKSTHEKATSEINPATLADVKNTDSEHINTASESAVNAISSSSTDSTRSIGNISSVAKWNIGLIGWLLLLGILYVLTYVLPDSDNSNASGLNTPSASVSDDKTKSPKVFSHAVALTRDSGDDVDPTISPDGTRLAYMTIQDGHLKQMIKHLDTQEVIRVAHKESEGVGPISWSDDGTLIAYLVASDDSCQYYIRPIENMTLGEATVIHNCPLGSYGKVIFTHENHRLVYAESSGHNAPYSLFEINLQTNKKRRVKQPELYLGGNYVFDLHPFENKLLISSPDKQQWEGFFALDLDSDELTLLFKQDAYTCCGVWRHDGNGVVMMGDFPASQLVSFDLAGENRRVIYAGSQELYRPVRHPNGVDYLFVSGLDNSDIHILSLSSQGANATGVITTEVNATEVIANSSVDDRLATLAEDKVAYVSTKTGTEEVWIKRVEQDQSKKLTSFNDSRHYLDLKWSYDKKKLAALTINEIHIIDANSGEFERLKVPQAEIRGMSFKSNNTISYSVASETGWQVISYNINNHEIEYEDKKWAYIQYAANGKDTLWQDQDGKLYSGVIPSLFEADVFSSENLLHQRTFNLKKRDDFWYWHSGGRESKLMQFNQKDQTTNRLIDTHIIHFDVFNDMLVYGTLLKGNTDVYKTQ